MTPDGPPVPDEPSIFPFAGSIHPLLFEAGCGVAIATAGRTSGQCYYRVPRLRAVGVLLALSQCYSANALRKIDFHLAQILAARSVLGLGFDFVLEVQLYAEG
jgi:hypothetical protein